MQINKLSEKYDFHQDGANYILNLGEIKKGEDTTTELIISGVEDPTLAFVKSTCGCTVVTPVIYPDKTVSVKVKYKECDSSFTKVLEVGYNNVKTGIIKITGKCK